VTVTGDLNVVYVISGVHMSAAASSPRTGQDRGPRRPARRPDVLLRRRMPEGHQVSAWWMIGAFAGVSIAVVALLNLFPAPDHADHSRSADRRRQR
jgi:hypothetical protein